MDTLFRVKFNWGLYILILIFIRTVWIDLSWLSFIALAITLHQFLLLFYSVGAVIPIRYLAGAFMCLQMLLGPTLAFNGLDAYQKNPVYKMKIPEAEYFAYVIPAMICFIAGLHITAGKLKGEVINQREVARFIDNSGNLPYIFIAVGFLSSFVAGFFGAAFAFVFYLLGGFKFIGAFMVIMGTRQLKTWVLVLVFGSIIASTLQHAMFHDLITWLIMLGAVLAIKYKPSVLLKTICAAGFILMAVVIQQVKGDYRRIAWGGGTGGQTGGIESFQNAIEAKEGNNSLFSSRSLATSNIRINQGFIVTNIMNYVPAQIPYANGEELGLILQSAFLPRIIAPNKLNAGDQALFTKYSGIHLMPGTSMALGPLGDGYVNFGVTGGCIFMFFLGLLFSEVLNGFYRYSKYYPFLLLFVPLVFYYPIRPDCELQTSLGHLVKSCFLIYMLILFWKKDLSKVMKKRTNKLSGAPAIPATGSVP
ncbi:hypothetical protein FW778_21585 [Ginsengibacter hankyongi]|uniref:Oligosaccharide repeat unit polymerase n=1 Tax=Ginsengibacter hankyongi TaxID=2607284 RepID=A0A5J5IAX8_9BACT|nr:hypothetical protein [Ginsengibacter hankyongi]KAA9034605.1 hypothetical protein FW778_21585 [Ginsengibacter hankyongi]